MLTPDQFHKLVAAAFFALPLVSVKIVDITLSESGPAPVSAAQPAAASPLLPPPAAPTSQPSSLTTLASPFADAQTATAFGPNPFYYVPVTDSRRDSASASSNPQPPASGLQSSATDFSVGLIMNQPNGDWAIINGETYRIGQQIGHGPWRLVSIDSNTRSVVLENAQTGQTLTRAVDLRHP